MGEGRVNVFTVRYPGMEENEETIETLLIYVYTEMFICGVDGFDVIVAWKFDLPPSPNSASEFLKYQFFSCVFCVPLNFTTSKH